jgi:hypothetical protein
MSAAGTGIANRIYAATRSCGSKLSRAQPKSQPDSAAGTTGVSLRTFGFVGIGEEGAGRVVSGSRGLGKVGVAFFGVSRFVACEATLTVHSAETAAIAIESHFMSVLRSTDSKRT